MCPSKSGGNRSKGPAFGGTSGVSHHKVRTLYRPDVATLLLPATSTGEPELLPEAAFERSLAASVHCVRARRGTSAWRMPAQWPASASVAASWSARDLRSRCFCCSSALGGVPAPPPTVVNVRARAAQGRCAIEGRSRCDRSAACGHRVRQRASPVDLIQPCRAARTLLLAMLASLSRASVSSVAYVQ